MTDTIERAQGDPAVVAARAVATAKRQRVAELDAITAAPVGQQVVETRERREAREQAMELRPQLADAENAVQAALAAACERIIASYAPERARRLKHLRVTGQAAHAAARAVEEHDAAVAHAVGRLPQPQPCPVLLAPLAAQLERLQREIDGPRPKPPEPGPGPGKKRLRLLAPFYDRPGMAHLLPGDEFDADDALARDLLTRRPQGGEAATIAVEVVSR